MLSHIYVFTAVVVSFVFFDAVNMSQAFSYIKAMFGADAYPLVSAEFSYYFRSYFVVLVIAFLGATPIPKSFCKGIQDGKQVRRLWHWLNLWFFLSCCLFARPIW